MAEPSAGEIWDLELGPQIGWEQGGAGPVLALSSGVSNRLSNGICVVARSPACVSTPEDGRSGPSVIVGDPAG